MSNVGPPDGMDEKPEDLPSDQGQHERCTRRLAQVVESNPYVTHLLKSMESRGCHIPDNFFRCRPCKGDKPVGAYFHSETGITLCENGTSDKTYLANFLVHELVHAYDHCRAKMEWNNCQHIACTEIRAANLSGDCHWPRELFRGYGYRFFKHHQDCVRRRATLSVSMHPHCQKEAKEAVDKVWASCFPDIEPFDAIP